MIKDCKLWAEKNKIEFKFNNYFPIETLNLMRSVLVAEKKGFSQNFINKVFDAIWKDGLNLNDTSIFEKLLKNLDINPKTFLTEATDLKIKDDLKRRTNNAYSKGIFGAPSFIINNKIFWGQDRIDFVVREANK
jgi:2-hydroxychromene-2-carboxylate isomerase